MFESTRVRLRTVAMAGVVAALAVAGMAVAQGESQSGGGSHPAGPPPFAIGAPMKGLTYGELHVQKEGESQVIRLDEGKIVAVDSSSITLSENDGSEVTIALGEGTMVLAGPGSESTIADLSVGEQVLVSGPEGGTAKSVMVMPKKGEPGGTPPAGQMPPPLGGGR